MSYYGEVFNREKIINSTQTTGGPISKESKQWNAEFVAMRLEELKAYRLAASMPCADQMRDGFAAVADMTAEEEAELNAQIEREEK